MSRRISVYEQYGEIPLEALTDDRLEFMRSCLALRLQGVDYDSMAIQLKSDYTSCRKAVKEALAHSVSEIADDVRILELNRLDALLLSHWDNREIPRHADVILKLMDRRAKFLGLDTVQTDPTDAAEVLRNFLRKAAENTGAGYQVGKGSRETE